MDLSPKEYIVDHISGDYAFLRLLSAPDQGLNQVAMALLPPETDTGVKLRWEMFSYTVI